MRRPSIALSLLAFVFAAACAGSDVERVEQPLTREQYEFSDPDAWRIDSDGVLSLESSSDYLPPFRSPRSIALLSDRTLGSFTASVDAMQTGREYGHRDLCFFFGYQSPQRYYYVHLATTPDQNAHNVFLVHDAARTNLAPVAATGVDWGQEEWHRVRLERDVPSGEIRVYFDDDLVLEVVDRTLEWGAFGLGSFDDTGRFTRLRIEGESASPEARVEYFLR